MAGATQQKRSSGRSAAAAPPRRRRASAPDHHHHPELVIWETTQACDSACQQRRGCTGPKHHPDELTTTEGAALLDAIAAMGTDEVLLCGGDPALRHDLAALVAQGRAAGLAVTLAAVSTPMMSAQRLRELKRAGLGRVALSVHGFNAATHDAFCGRDGAFAETLRVLGDADAAGLDTSIETTVHDGIEQHLETMSYLVSELGASAWTLLFEPDAQLSAARAEEVWRTLVALEERGDVVVGALGAPALARVRMQRARPARRGAPGADASGVWRGTRAPNDGCGLMFVSHVGDLSPSPWLPLSAGNARNDDLGAVYREHALFVGLRDVDALDGRCGACDYRGVCGGSRARAWHAAGSTHAADPLCTYDPPTRPR